MRINLVFNFQNAGVQLQNSSIHFFFYDLDELR